MEKKKSINLIIFPASMRNVGLLYHFTYKVISLSRAIESRPNYELLVVYEKGEQNLGLEDKLKNSLNHKQIQKVENMYALRNIVKKHLSNAKYKKVIVLSQGIIQFLILIRLKIIFRKKLWLSTRLNSFKHRSWIRYPLTFFWSFLLYKYCDFTDFQCEYTRSIFWGSKKLFRKNKAGFIPLGLEEYNPDSLDLKNIDINIKDFLSDSSFMKLIYLAQFHKGKGHKEIISCAKLLKSKGSKFKLLLLGNGKEFYKIKQLVDLHNLNQHVLMPGRVSREYIPYILSKIDCSLITSEVETFGHNILEPMFYGSTVISTPVGIAKDIVQHCRTGLLLNSKFNRVETLVKYVEYLSKNKNFLDYLKVNAFEHVREIYKWDKVNEQQLRLLDLYVEK